MERKEHIINTYLRLGSKVGFDSVPLSAIAFEEGITKATLFSHFKDYGDLKKQADLYCINILQSKEIEVNFGSASAKEVFENLINSFIDTFAQPPLNCWLSLLEQKSLYDPVYLQYSNQIDNMITARTTIALDYCVQRGWSDLNDTDYCALLITPFIRKTLSSSEEDFESLENVINTFVEMI